MNSKEITALMEAYSSIYNDDLEYDLDDDFSGIENLTNDEIDEIVEETIFEMIEEGYDFDEVEEIFEGVLLELNPYAPAGSKEARAYNRATTASKRSAERKAGRAAAVQRVKGAVSGAIGKVKKAVSSGVSAARKVVDEPARGYAARRQLIPSKSGKSKLRSDAIQGKQRTSAGRRQVRSAVVRDVASRVAGKISGKVSSGVGKVKGAASSAKTAVKGKIRGAALGVAERMKEEVDIYDIILSHLLDEGYAETYESAEKIMVNMSEDWRDDIIENLTPAQIEKIARQAAGKSKKKPTKIKAGMRE